MKGLKLKIRCRFCEAEATIRLNEAAKDPRDVRYGCTNGHIFHMKRNEDEANERTTKSLRR